ncbi:hypothetical protein PLESTB_001152000 [Pleodorina starrii]|uniref:Cyanobacterial aminoacyl-tRNA synthetase CAAD domain-containing protein n=1 Tax=Pleodorina starrii TaxID=330485 RepID=A0A9W6BRW1_9CHLO|nr:hypothetical protein PLESTM_001783600 [Pleodorina starrii]GLC56815.1 hypothetical protein PLESTB_001152000 [Pleodorina starrii]GLC68151.1 hypothetical protein PLESTF_000653900 [Pleodorina starrii]
MALTLRCHAPLSVAKRTVRRAGRPAVHVLTRKQVVRASAEPTSEPTSAAANESLQKVRATATEAWTWLKTKWEATEDSEKPAVVVILVGVIVAQIAIGATIDVVDRIPVVSTLLQLVGLVVTSLFIFKISTDPQERETVKTSMVGFLEKVTGK